MIVLYFLFIIPIFLSFKTNFSDITEVNILKFIPIYFGLDIIVNLNTCYYSKGTLITDRISIIKNYFSQYSMYNILSIIPLTVFISRDSIEEDTEQKFDLKNQWKLLLLLFLFKI